MIHATSSHRPEIVMFGTKHKLRLPLVLDAGPKILVNGLNGGQIKVSQFSGTTEQRTVSTDVEEVIRAVVELGGTYPDVVQMLQQAKQSDALTSRFRVNALPEGGREFLKKSERPEKQAGAKLQAQWARDAISTGFQFDIFLTYVKALELNGFKSFADRTRFEFPEGITAVVGPNGSGKSNVVDAIKWVLGSQSAKAMRGKEMTDVIFSGAQGRAQTNAAEVTLIFDNESGRLDFDADEVQITRRVYRSGEGEYLINRQPCRLKDIREVFAGTGVSTGAYSIIGAGTRRCVAAIVSERASVNLRRSRRSEPL